MQPAAAAAAAAAAFATVDDVAGMIQYLSVTVHGDEDQGTVVTDRGAAEVSTVSSQEVLFQKDVVRPVSK